MQARLDRGLVAVVVALASTSSAAFTQLTPFETEVNAWTHAVRQHQAVEYSICGLAPDRRSREAPRRSG
jgi:hypothetical protein